MLKLSIRFRAKCPKHPRYRPEIDGPGAIRGACATCESLWDVHLYSVYLRNAIERASLLVSPPERKNPE